MGALLPHGYRNCIKSTHNRTPEQEKERGLSRCPELGEIKARSWSDTEATVRDLVPLKRCEDVGLRVSTVIDSHGGSGRAEIGSPPKPPHLRIENRHQPPCSAILGSGRISRWEANLKLIHGVTLFTQKPHIEGGYAGFHLRAPHVGADRKTAQSMASLGYRVRHS